MNFEATSKSLGGPSELVMVMPIKQGLVDCLETRSYRSRLATVAEIFNDLRVGAREARARLPFSDVVDRIATIHSVFITLLDDEKVLLAVSFDQPWEPYIRRVQERIGALLDTVLCNCEGYTEAHASDLGYEPFARWIRRYQLDTATFYQANSLTVTDARALAARDWAVRLGPAQGGGALNSEPTAERAARLERDALAGDLAGAAAVARLGIKAAYALHAMTALFSKGSRDEQFLHRAATDVLGEFIAEGWPTHAPPTLQRLFATELAWLARLPRAMPAGPAPLPPPAPAELQGGIVERYGNANVGLLLFVRITDVAAARALLRDWVANGRITSALVDATGDGPFVNLALTASGLEQLGLDEAHQRLLPKAFRDGMAARAGLLGDVRENHPEQWLPPRRNWPLDAPGGTTRIELDSVDLLLQLRVRAADFAEGADFTAAHPLHALAQQLAGEAAGGLVVMAVEAMYARAARQEHFGFEDGVSQPSYSLANGRVSAEEPPLGELLLGQTGCRADLRPTPSDALPAVFRNGSFLVLRKHPQHVARFEAATARAAASVGLPADELRALMMGRRKDGSSLSPTASDPRGIDFASDPRGAGCPLQSHVRRSHPRGLEAPRLLRRGMSYGAPAQGDANDGAERGLVFQAYCADLAEQFEVVQRWINGGNSTSLTSYENDPIVGVAPPGQGRSFGFLRDGVPVHVDLGREPFVSLAWGLYTFVPSLAGLRALLAVTDEEANARRVAPARPSPLARLQRLGSQDAASARAAWKLLLEEKDQFESGERTALWDAVRASGGLVALPREPYRDKRGHQRSRGVWLLGSDAYVHDVLADATHFTVRDYDRRLSGSIGRIYLGLDPGPRHAREATPSNDAIRAVGRANGFAVAHGVATAALKLLTPLSPPIDLPLGKYVDLVLAGIARHWFGVPDDVHMMTGGEPAFDGNAHAAVAHCPFHFTSPSRYVFQPWPTDFVRETAEREGRTLAAAANQLARARHTEQPTAALAKALHDAFPARQDDSIYARTLVGVMMGMLPTVQGNVLGVLERWIGSRTLWRLQDDYLRATSIETSAFARAERLLWPALDREIARRPVPGLVHRRVRTSFRFADVDLQRGDRVVLGLASASADRLTRGLTASDPVFAYGHGATVHGCPGQQLAIGTLLGMIAALLDAGTLRPTASDLALLLVP